MAKAPELYDSMLNSGSATQSCVFFNCL